MPATGERDGGRAFGWVGYAIALALVADPLLDVAIATWPWRVGALNWRFGTFGLLSNELVSPLLGLCIAAFAARTLGHRVFLRSLAVLSGVGTLLLMAAAAMFVLDAVQMRRAVRPEAMNVYDVSSLKALLSSGLAFLVLASLAIAGFRTSRRRKSSGTFRIEKVDS